jgi:rhodanese-related sulfurtransferase
MMNSLPQVTVQDLAEKLAEKGTEPQSNSIQLVDVREAQELAIASLPGFINLPLSESESWAIDIHSCLNAETETWVLCHHGMRSAQMCQWLMSQGFTNVKNISGGIDAYSIQVDRSVPQY